MLRITTHIERLLLVHDCVIVPKFGGFVLQTVPSVYKETEQRFGPVRKEIVFNTTLQHNDGLLSESYMQVYAMDYRKAQSKLEEDLEQLRSVLQEEKQVQLGKIGSFVLGEEGQLIYLPTETNLFSVDSYGLSAFQFPLLQSLQTTECQEEERHRGKKKDTLYIPISHKLIQIVAASAAAIAMFLLISTPVKDVNQSAYTASFIPSQIVSYTSPAEVMPAKKADTRTPSEDPMPKPLPVATPVVVEAKEAPKPTAAAAKAPISHVAKPFHVVIASFPSEAQANQYMAGVDRTIYKQVNTVVRDGKYRIYADKFDNREAAESYIETLRKTEEYKNAWLLISR